MPMELDAIVQGGGVAAVVIAVIQVVKPAIPAKYQPLAALFLGALLGGGVFFAQGDPWTSALIKGVVAGLAASGAYDQKKIISSS